MGNKYGYNGAGGGFGGGGMQNLMKQAQQMQQAQLAAQPQPESQIQVSCFFIIPGAQYSRHDKCGEAERQPFGNIHPQAGRVEHGEQKPRHAARPTRAPTARLAAAVNKQITMIKLPSYIRFIYSFASNRIRSSSSVRISRSSIRIFPPTIISRTSPDSAHSNMVCSRFPLGISLPASR